MRFLYLVESLAPRLLLLPLCRWARQDLTAHSPTVTNFQPSFPLNRIDRRHLHHRRSSNDLCYANDLILVIVTRAVPRQSAYH